LVLCGLSPATGASLGIPLLEKEAKSWVVQYIQVFLGSLVALPPLGLSEQQFAVITGHHLPREVFQLPRVNFMTLYYVSRVLLPLAGHQYEDETRILS